MFGVRVRGAFVLLFTIVATPRSVRSQSVDDRAAARAALSEAFLAADRDSIDRWIDDAVAHARKAVAAAPNDADAHYWLAAALGRRAHRANFAGSLRAGKESYQEARRALAIDSTHAGAHAVVAQILEAGARYSRVTRILVAATTGMGEIRHATMADAEREYRTAVRLAPESLLFRNDLGRFLGESGRFAEAEEQWRVVQTLPMRAPVDAWLRDDLRRRLDEAERRR